jgi:hypothetical protein
MPATANGDAAPALAHPIGAQGIPATAQHALPGVVGTSAAASCLSVTARHTRIEAGRRALTADIADQAATVSRLPKRRIDGNQWLSEAVRNWPCERETGLEPATSTLGR